MDLCVGNLFFKDEARFRLNGYISNQNHRIRSAENPHALHENPLNLTKVGFRCRVSRKKLSDIFLLRDKY